VLGIIAVNPPQRLVVYKVPDRTTNTEIRYGKISIYLQPLETVLQLTDGADI
jgi:hypothetical protein